MRVVTDESLDAWKKRDDQIRAVWQDVDTLKEMYDSLYNQPFEDQGGYARTMPSKAS